MKGNPKIIECLNGLLAEELTAINQYMVHSEMCANWNYERLHTAIEARAIVEMKHAEKIIGRILFLEGTPTVSHLNKISIGANVKQQLENDHKAELIAVNRYNKAVALAAELTDHGTRDMLTSILKDEEEHVDWLEAQLDQIQQMSIQIYLAEQSK